MITGGESDDKDNLPHERWKYERRSERMLHDLMQRTIYLTGRLTNILIQSNDYH